MSELVTRLGSGTKFRSVIMSLFMRSLQLQRRQFVKINASEIDALNPIPNFLEPEPQPDNTNEQGETNYPTRVSPSLHFQSPILRTRSLFSKFQKLAPYPRT